ncbi:craniofacial development protein 2 [Plakobranchus ocellatus]|uniref:Craniofacial development protein 2 n=1 Tax=Plakobranchus ocellatus TaxID=259542 RepID=A0AAV3XYS3_9GAST|nr:craniofacial development protein 2 [Plakobranchus ocellatus]
MSSILKNRNISLSTKMRTLKSYIWSMLLYGCECWTISNNIKRNWKLLKCYFLEDMKKRAPKRDLEKNGGERPARPLRRQPEQQQTCLNEEPLPSPPALDRSERIGGVE